MASYPLHQRHFTKMRVTLGLCLCMLLSSSLTLASKPSHTSIKALDFLGPFPSGMTEIEGDPLAGGMLRGGGKVHTRVLPKSKLGSGEGHNCTRDDILDRLKGCPQTFYSELATGGQVSWSRYPLRADGSVQIGFPTPQAPVDFNKLVQSLSSIHVQVWQGWAVGKFVVNEGGRYSIKLNPVHTFYIDSLADGPLTGDIYSNAWSMAVVNLASGTHSLKIPLRAKGVAQFSIRIERLQAVRGEAPLKFAGLALPKSVHPFLTYAPNRAGEVVGDVVEGSLPFASTSFLALPVVNQGDYWLYNVRVKSFTSSTRKGLGGAVLPEVVLAAPPSNWQSESYRSNLAPGGAGMHPLWFKLSATSSDGVAVTEAWWKAYRDKDSCLSFRVVLEGDINLNMGSTLLPSSAGEVRRVQTNPVTVSLKCREWDQSFVFAWRGTDGSPMAAAAVRPHEKCNKERGCTTVVSWSGVGVSARNQADAHKWMPPGSNKYLFGFPDQWLLAPDRAGAHNSEGSGHLAATQALAYLVAHTRGTPYHANASRVMSAGHSRGGHGALMLATHMPDSMLALVSAGGWGDREDYGDANKLFELDTQLAHMSPFTRSIFEATIAQNDMHFLAGQLKGVPTMIRLGSDDTTVPVFHTRRLARILSEQGVEVDYSEVPGKPHWWWDTSSPNDGGVMHDGTMREFFASKDTPDLPPMPQSFSVLSMNPATFFWGKGGLSIVQVDSRLVLARLDVQRHTPAKLGRPEIMLISTVNVRRISVDLKDRYRPSRMYTTGLELFLDEAEEPIFLAPSPAAAIAAAADKGLVSFPLEDRLDLCLDPDLSPDWSPCAVSPEELEHSNERHPGTYGPMRQVFQHEEACFGCASKPTGTPRSKPFIIVVGTSAMYDHDEDHERLLRLANYFQLGHQQGVHAAAPVVRDVDVDWEQLRKEEQNVVLIGGPDINGASSLWMRDAETSIEWPRSPTCPDGRCWSESHFRAGSCLFEQPQTAVAFINPMSGIAAKPRFPSLRNQSENLVLMLAGTDVRAITELLHFQFAVNTPLTRAPFTNMIPDYLITGPQFSWKGLGGLQGAGFFDRHWHLDDKQGFVHCEPKLRNMTTFRQPPAELHDEL